MAKIVEKKESEKARPAQEDEGDEEREARLHLQEASSA